MKTFLIDHCPSAALKREVRRRSLTIVGRFDTCELRSTRVTPVG